MNVTRKAFIGVGVTALGAGLFGGAIKAFAGEGVNLRPPLVTDDAQFMARCIRCYRCVSVCPEGCISPATINDGFVEIKTPKLDYHEGYCTFCNECVEVCPTRCFTVANPDAPETGRIGYAVVFPERCLAYSEGCLVCDEACPYEAITPDEYGHPIVNLELCNGCGVCEYVCPALVYRRFIGGTLRGIAVVRDERQEARFVAMAAAETG